MCIKVDGKRQDMIRRKYRREKMVEDEDRPFIDSQIRAGSAKYKYKNGKLYAKTF